NGTPGTELDWSINGELKCHVTREHWDLELKISRKAFGVKSFEGRQWVVQLLRASAPGGVYFAGWVGEYWMKWARFGEVAFDSSVPVFRFTESGKAQRGQPDLNFEVIGTTEARQPVTVTVTGTDGTGKKVYTQARKVTVTKGQKKALRFNDPIPWTERGNVLHIRATTTQADDDGKAREVVLYEVKMPVLKLTDKLYKETVDVWLQERPKEGTFEWKYVYWPSYGVAETTVDLDFFGMKDEVLKASAFAVEVHKAASTGKPIAQGKADIDNLTGRFVLQVGELARGDYEARMTLFGADGKTVVGRQVKPFVRHTYAWEGNTIGKEDVLLPPYKPLEVDGTVLKPIMREYELGCNGLFKDVRAAGGRGMESILSSPIRLEADLGGAPMSMICADPRVTKATDTKVPVEAETYLGGAVLQTRCVLEYDGWYDVTMTVSPKAGIAEVGRLSLVIPLWKGADTMYVQRGDDGVAGGNKIGDIPAGTGVVWDSSRLLPPGSNKDVWQTFVPIVFAGNGDKGIWWFAEQNRDWTSNSELPTVQYVRTDGGVEVHIHVFAAPVTISRPRVIHFALLADPVKKMVGERKHGWGYPGTYHGSSTYAHMTSGWRMWGKSADGYYVDDHDLEQLRRFMLGIMQPPFKKPGQGNRYRNFVRATQNGDPCVLYGSTKNTMVDLPAFDTYSGEWLLNTSIPSDEKAPKSIGWNLQGTSEFLLKRYQHEVGLNFTRSQEDCFTWYYNKLLRQTPTNGTWWDNRSSHQIKDYDPERKQFYWRWNVFQRRRLCKRLNAIGWVIGRRPWWLNNMHVDWSFNQVSWHIENDFYVDDPTNTLSDQLTLGQFRGLCRIKRGIIHRLASRYGGGAGFSSNLEQKRRGRNIVGLCLLHDIGAYRWGNYRDEHHRLPQLLHEYVGFFNEEGACPFTGYWRSGHLVEVTTDGVACSVYRGKDRAVLVFMNLNDKDVDAGFAIRKALLGREPVRVYDGESKQVFFDQAWPRGSKRQGRAWGEYHAGELGIARHDVRFVVVE
ncbi:MAG: glycoside hydrolase domain-containing protein, partial [Planctomycetota bacterium]